MLLYAPIWAKTTEVLYKVNFGILGELGEAKVVMTTSKDSYKIDIWAYTTGVVNKLSQNRQEHHTSKGRIINGVLISDSYSVVRSYAKRVDKKIYNIDHKNKKVTKTNIKLKDGKQASKKTTILPFYSTNDLLSLYGNISKEGDTKQPGKKYRYPTVGAERQDGYIDIITPTKEELPNYRKALGGDAKWYYNVVVHQKIFASNNGEFMLAIDSDGVASSAILKNLLLFNDLKARRVK
mgnify:CR=1 FL=1